MNICASLVVRNEINRFLAPCIEHLRAFTDRIVVLDDASDDGTEHWLRDQADEQLIVERQEVSTFYRHEGQTRTRLLEVTLEQEPTHIVNLDADELVSDGPALRAMIEADPDVPAWHLPIEEVWAANEGGYFIRDDGAWNQGRTLAWRVPQLGRLAFPNRALACGRVPLQLRSVRAQPSGVSLLHVGWLDERERVVRHARYTKHDNGRFHAGRHLASILWPPEKVGLQARAWPAGLLSWRDAILEHAGVTA